MRNLLISGALALSLSSLPAAAQGCFLIHQFDSWRAPDARTIVIRVAQTRYYRLDLSGSCPMLTMPGAHLITKSVGSDQVCSAVDWDLAVSQDGPGNIPSHCIVKTMTKLTPAEVGAFPKKFRP